MRTICKKTLALLLALAMLAGLSLSVSARGCGCEDAALLWFQSGDYDISYRVAEAVGEEVGRIFFLHGFVSSSVYWDGLAALFSEAGYRCVMMDLPGFGYSTRESKDITAKYREDIAAELMEALAPGEAWMVAGHSMGGSVALNLAARYPEKVSELLLLAPALGSAAGAVMPEFVTELLGGVMTLLLRPLLYITPAVKLLAAAANADLCYGLQYDTRRITDPLKLPGTVKSILYMSQRTMAVDVEGLADLTLPILVIWGESDYVISADMTESLRAALPQAQHQSLPGGHMFSEQYPAEVFARAMAFLEG